jgi:hypothetical protein
VLKLILKIFFLPFLVSISFGQSMHRSEHTDNSVNAEKKSVVEINKTEKITPYENINQSILLNSESEFKTYFRSRDFTKPAVKNQFNFNIVSSFRKNIRFGGFWQNYAIINFTPDMFIQPADFISIYASHNYSNYIPIKAVKENVKPMVIRGAAVLAIDNSVRFLLAKNVLIQSLVSFAAKILAITFIEKSYPAENKPLEFRYYYYAISIRF